MYICFVDIMKRLRQVDDNIILKMNNTDSTSPEACKALFNAIAEAYTRREDAIIYCLDASLVAYYHFT